MSSEVLYVCHHNRPYGDLHQELMSLWGTQDHISSWAIFTRDKGFSAIGANSMLKGRKWNWKKSLAAAILLRFDRIFGCSSVFFFPSSSMGCEISLGSIVDSLWEEGVTASSLLNARLGNKSRISTSTRKISYLCLSGSFVWCVESILDNVISSWSCRPPPSILYVWWGDCRKTYLRGWREIFGYLALPPASIDFR